MHVILGGTGHVGSATARALLAAKQEVTVVGRHAADALAWEERGARFAAIDVTDNAALRGALRGGDTAFLVNPPADPATDTDAVERASAAAIVEALAGSGLKRIVALSTYGAQPGDAIGDLSVLYDFEQALHAQPIATAILRAAYYLTNWDAQFAAARAGAIVTPYPADLAMPMVAPDDLGRAAADLLTAHALPAGPIHVEGPRRYAAQEVADAFARALGRRVVVEVVPRDRWEDMYRGLGFSPAAARAFVRMAAATLDGMDDLPPAPVRGTTTLEAYVARLASADAAP